MTVKKQNDDDDAREDKSEGVLYYMENGEKQDAVIHDSILAEGDEAAAKQVSLEHMISMGFEREEAERFLGIKKE